MVETTLFHCTSTKYLQIHPLVDIFTAWNVLVPQHGSFLTTVSEVGCNDGNHKVVNL